MLDRLSPILLGALGVLALSGMDALIKHLAADLNAFTIAFWRYVFGALVAGAIYVGAGRPTITADMWRTHLVRGAFAAGAGVTFFYALGVLPLAQAIAIAFIAPLIIPFAAWIMLGERVRPASLVAGLVGFAGAFVAVSGEPASADGRHPEHAYGVAAVLASALLYAITIVMLRARAGKDGAPIVGLMQALVPAALVAGPALALAPPPPAHIFPTLALMGLMGASGWFLLIKAYARAEAQRLAPLEFTALGWASLFGFVFFAEIPSAQTLLGAVLIIAAVVGGEWAARRAAVSV